MIETTGNHVPEIEAQQNEKMQFWMLALILTLLDKERYNAAYYSDFRTEDDKYIPSIDQTIQVLTQGVPPEAKKNFLEANEHLTKMFD